MLVPLTLFKIISNIRENTSDCPRQRAAESTAGVHGGDALCELRFALRLHRFRAFCTIHGVAINKHRTPDIVPAPLILKNAMQHIPALRIILQITIGVTYGQIRLQSFVICPVQPLIQFSIMFVSFPKIGRNIF